MEMVTWEWFSRQHKLRLYITHWQYTRAMRAVLTKTMLLIWQRLQLKSMLFVYTSL